MLYFRDVKESEERIRRWGQSELNSGRWKEDKGQKLRKKKGIVYAQQSEEQPSSIF